MSSIMGIGTIVPPMNLGTIGTIPQAASLLASELSLSTPALLASPSAIVDLSGRGQLLTAAATFQEQLRFLQPGTATSGHGQNFGNDLASLAAETQSFVDAFNGLQNTVANINGASSQLGGNATDASGLIQSLNTLAQANYANGNSPLSNLSQLGIELKPALVPGGSGSLSIDLNTLKSAFNTDATGAFSLLSKAANAFGDLAGNFVGQAGGQFLSLATLTQSSPIVAALTDNLTYGLLSQAQTIGGLNLSNTLLTESLNGSISLQQAILATNEYLTVSGLLG